MECSCYLLANYSYNCFILASFYAFLSFYLAYIFRPASYWATLRDYCFIFYTDYFYIFSLYSREYFLIFSICSDCSLRLLFNSSIINSFSFITYRASSFYNMNWPDSIILEDKDYCNISFSFFTSFNSSFKFIPSFFHTYD